MATTRQNRINAIQTIVNSYIAPEDGEIITDPDFTALLRSVIELRAMSRGKSWQNGIDGFARTVRQAEGIFREQYDGNLYPFGDLTFAGRQEYCRLFRWAILQGSIYATAGAY